MSIFCTQALTYVNINVYQRLYVVFCPTGAWYISVRVVMALMFDISLGEQYDISALLETLQAQRRTR